MNELYLWKKLPKRKHIYIYDDYEDMAIDVYSVKGTIMCKFKHKLSSEKQGDFTSDFIRESVCYGDEITKEEYDKF